MRIVISPAPIDQAAALTGFRGGDLCIGACASFVGTCRGDGPDGPIAWLELEHYPGFTEKEITRIGLAIGDRYETLDLLVIHRIGRIAPGDAIVLVAATSIHRAAAFAAVAAMMDYLKTDAPFWKREMREDGVHRIEPTDEDRRRRARHEV